jgi:excisionase family DNA binding protein
LWLRIATHWRRAATRSTVSTRLRGQSKGEAVSEVREKDVLNVEETAEFLGFAPYTIREKARDGEIPGRKIGGEWRFSRRQLLEWVEEGDREHVPA